MNLRSLLPTLFAAALATSAGAQNLTTVDLLVLYTPGATQRYGASGVLTRIHHLVAVSNQAYADSGASLRLRLVHARQVNYSDSVDSSRALDDLTDGSLHPQAAQLRDQYGADLTTLMRPYARDGLCGIAWVGGYRRGGLSPGDADYAYSHVTIDCSDDTLPHELGHNMGLAHSRRQDPEGGTFPHSVGHGVDRVFSTIMAYASAFGATPVSMFSNPDRTCRGLPCGVHRSDPDDGADATHSLGAVRNQLAAYRAEIVDSGTPDDPGDPDDPEPGPAEIRITSKKLKPVPGNDLVIEWESAAVDSVDVAYRQSWTAGKQKLESAWIPIASGVSGNSATWTVPTFQENKSTVQLRLTGRDAEGNAVTEQVTRQLEIKQRKNRKTKK
jgi:hypothetical protein